MPRKITPLEQSRRHVANLAKAIFTIAKQNPQDADYQRIRRLGVALLNAASEEDRFAVPDGIPPADIPQLADTLHAISSPLPDTDCL